MIVKTETPISNEHEPKQAIHNRLIMCHAEFRVTSKRLLETKLHYTGDKRPRLQPTEPEIAVRSQFCIQFPMPGFVACVEQSLQFDRDIIRAAHEVKLNVAVAVPFSESTVARVRL